MDKSYGEFLDHFYSDCREDELPLVARQTPCGLDSTGKPMYSWPAYPWDTTRLNTPGPWYLNVGVFKAAGGASAKRSNVSRVAFVMLDDIGTKVDVEVLNQAYPTAVIETSLNNYQAFYALSPWVEPDVFSAAVSALARAGLTDPGAKGPARWCRLPGSVNIKEGRGGFVSRVTEWNPENVWSLEELLSALGVTLENEDWIGAAGFSEPLRLGVVHDDPVLNWLSMNGLLLGDTGRAYWDVLCPNHEAHTPGGGLDAGYDPAGGHFKCHHASCREWLHTREFFEWVVENGGPAGVIGGGHEQLTAGFAGLALPSGGLFSEASTAEARVARSHEGLAIRRLLTEWLWGQRNNVWWRHGTSEYPIKAEAFDILHAQLPTTVPAGTKADPDKRKKIPASKWWADRRDVAATTVEGFTYWPGEGVIVEMGGLRWGNRWTDRHVRGVAGDTSVWHAHLERVIPDLEERTHVLQWMAWHAQNPGRKCNHQLLIGGEQGIGKDSLIEPLLYAVGGLEGRRANVGHCDLSDLDGDWGYHLENEIIVVQELREQTSRARRELANQLKACWASPPDVLTIKHKGMHPHVVKNVSGWVVFSNFRDCLSIEDGDRRLYVVWSDAPRMSEGEAKALWAWYEAGGLDAMAWELHTMDVSSFNPAAAPPMTEAKRAMISSSRSDGEDFVLEMIQDGVAPFDKGVVAPFSYLASEAIRSAGNLARLHIRRPDVMAAMESSGWVCRGLCEAREDGIDYPRQMIWTRDEEFWNSQTTAQIRLALARGPITAVRAAEAAGIVPAGKISPAP